jgi:hypothetical protein
VSTMPTPADNYYEFSQGIVEVSIREPELMRYIIGELSDCRRAHMRAASHVCWTLLNNSVTTVA